MRYAALLPLYIFQMNIAVSSIPKISLVSAITHGGLLNQIDAGTLKPP